MQLLERNKGDRAALRVALHEVTFVTVAVYKATGGSVSSTSSGSKKKLIKFRNILDAISSLMVESITPKSPKKITKSLESLEDH